MARILFLISALITLLLAAALVFMFLPQDTSDIAGYREDAQQAEVRDLERVLQEAVDRGHKVTLSEEEINRWLAKKLKIEQKGLLGAGVSQIDLGIRLEDGYAEIVLERRMFGRPITLSMFVQIEIEKRGNSSTKHALMHGGLMTPVIAGLYRGGRFGCLLVPQGYLYLVKPAFFQLSTACSKEIELAFREMMDVKIEKNQLVLHPRPSRPR